MDCAFPPRLSYRPPQAIDALAFQKNVAIDKAFHNGNNHVTAVFFRKLVRTVWSLDIIIIYCYIYILINYYIYFNINLYINIL